MRLASPKSPEEEDDTLLSSHLHLTGKTKWDESDKGLAFCWDYLRVCLELEGGLTYCPPNVMPRF